MQSTIIFIPEDKRGLVIGKEGSKIKEIRSRSGARLSDIDRRSGKLTITGSQTQINLAESMINDIINRDRGGGAGGYGDRRPPGGGAGGPAPTRRSETLAKPAAPAPAPSAAAPAPSAAAPAPATTCPRGDHASIIIYDYENDKILIVREGKAESIQLSTKVKGQPQFVGTQLKNRFTDVETDIHFFSNKDFINGLYDKYRNLELTSEIISELNEAFREYCGVRGDYDTVFRIRTESKSGNPIFQIRLPTSSYGVPKGGYETNDNNLCKTIIRECKEELGITIPENELGHLRHTTREGNFYWCVNGQTAQDILDLFYFDFYRQSEVFIPQFVSRVNPMGEMSRNGNREGFIIPDSYNAAINGGLAININNPSSKIINQVAVKPKCSGAVGGGAGGGANVEPGIMGSANRLLARKYISEERYRSIINSLELMSSMRKARKGKTLFPSLQQQLEDNSSSARNVLRQLRERGFTRNNIPSEFNLINGLLEFNDTIETGRAGGGGAGAGANLHANAIERIKNARKGGARRTRKNRGRKSRKSRRAARNN